VDYNNEHSLSIVFVEERRGVLGFSLQQLVVNT
jgi:hypothetical protein